jgi:hypothetical protein
MTLEDAAIQMRDAFDKLCEAIANSIRAFFDEVIRTIKQTVKIIIKIFKKRRLPRKLKKKYKKLGIYEDWKKGKIRK